MINPKVWGTFLEHPPALTDRTPTENILALQPLFYLKNTEMLSSFLEDPLPLVHFLAELAFTQKGLVYVIGDSHFVSKLVNEVIFTLLGVLTGEDSTKLLNSLALNAKQEQLRDNTLIAGQALNPGQIGNLESTIIWPVWLESCVGQEMCLTFTLYFNPTALEKSLSGAMIASGKDIDLKILGDVLVGQGGQIKAGQALRLSSEGSLLNIGTLIGGTEMTLVAENIGSIGIIQVEKGMLNLTASQDIVNIGVVEVGEGKAFLKAGRDIKELVLINSALPIPELSKTAIYIINGDLYYEAGRDLIQQGSQRIVNGNIEANAERDINRESIFQERTVNEFHTRRSYLVQRTTDIYPTEDIAAGDIIYTAGRHYTAMGTSDRSINGNIHLHGEESAEMRTVTHYATNIAGDTKSKAFSKSSQDMIWTTHRTQEATVYALNGIALFSSKGNCILEGVQYQAKTPLILCDGDIDIIEHEVTNQMHVITESSGFKPKIPVIDFIQSEDKIQHFEEHTLINNINNVLNMKSPLDLLSAINLLTQIPAFKADFATLAKVGLPTPAAIIGAILSKYISATLSFTISSTTMESTHTETHLSHIVGQHCKIAGENGDIHIDMKCEESLELVFKNLLLKGGVETSTQHSETESFSLNLGASLSGINAGLGGQISESDYSQTLHHQGKIQPKNITILVNDKLEIENAIVNGQVVNVSTVSIEIKQVIDTIRTEGSSSGGNVGVNIGWQGKILPYGSFQHAESVSQSQMVRFISGITGKSVSVTTKELIYNVASITASEELKIVADSIIETSMPETEDIDTAWSIGASLSIRSDGTSSWSVEGTYQDGDFYASAGYSPAILEAIHILKEFSHKVEHLFDNSKKYSMPEVKQTPILSIAQTQALFNQIQTYYRFSPKTDVEITAIALLASEFMLKEGKEHDEAIHIAQYAIECSKIISGNNLKGGFIKANAGAIAAVGVTSTILGCLSNPACAAASALLVSQAGQILHKYYWKNNHDSGNTKENSVTTQDKNTLPNNPEPPKPPEDPFKVFKNAIISQTTKYELTEIKKYLDNHDLKLQPHEGGAHGGHTEYKHIGWDDIKIMDRKLDPQKYDPNQRSIKGSSAFTDEPTAERVISQALRDNWSKIEDWILNSNKPNLRLKFIDNKIIGRGIVDPDITISDKTNARIILKKVGSSFRIFTAYPTN